jgi:hypothetical protein
MDTICTEQARETASRIRPMRVRLAVWAIFLAGLAARASFFAHPHLEGDEVVYQSLVQQLQAGRGYTLDGHPLLEQPGFSREQYGGKLFFHPPGGIVLFWIAFRAFRHTGFFVVQALSYVLFFWSMLSLARALKPGAGAVERLAVAALAAFAPIHANVLNHVWLDGPQLALTMAAAAAFAWSCRSARPALSVAAGLLLGYASLVKITAFLVVPALALLGWNVARESGASPHAAGAPAGSPGRPFLARLALFVVLASAVHSLWLGWQWAEVGTPFPIWSGKPHVKLIGTNSYVYQVTFERTPWVYLHLLPRVLATTVPALLLWAAQWSNRELRRTGAALLLWVAVIVAAHVWLGSLGYSKVLRYLILVTPATILLFARSLGAAFAPAPAGGSALAFARTGTGRVLVALAALGFALELAQGVTTGIADRDLIVPIVR